MKCWMWDSSVDLKTERWEINCLLLVIKVCDQGQNQKQFSVYFVPICHDRSNGISGGDARRPEMFVNKYSFAISANKINLKIHFQLGCLSNRF